MHFYEKINYILNFSNNWDNLNIQQNFKKYTGITTYAHQNFSRGPFICLLFGMLVLITPSPDLLFFCQIIEIPG